jgi:tetratricopeptide (TPR) repeat protein
MSDSSSSSPQKMRHLVYFEELSRLQETDPEWRKMAAGLVTLRLFDAWVTDGDVVLKDSWGVRAVRDAIEMIDDGTPVRSILSGILDVMESAQGTDLAAVGPRLLAYGRYLNLDGKWALAADVYTTVIAHTDPLEDSDIAIDANMHLGYCAATLGNWELAAAAYHEAGQIAEASGDIVKVLRARLADAKLLTERGNLPEAATVLDRAIDRASQHDVGEVHGLLKHQRGSVAFLRGEYERSVRFVYEAMTALQSPAARDRALADLAAAFAELGCRTAARDAHLILAATATEQYTRWMATINLMELAAFDMREPNFEQHRRELADSPLPPALAAVYHLYVGQGYQRFGKHELAIQSIEHALELANAHKLNRVMFEAETALADAKSGRRLSAPPATVPGESIRAIADELHTTRTAAVASY